MKTTEQQTKFIELRANGLPYSKIAQELKVSKPVLIQWQRECEREITQARFLAIDTMLEQYHVRKQHQIEELAMTLQKAREELAKRDLADVPTLTLLGIVERLEVRLNNEVASLKYPTGESDDGIYLLKDIGEVKLTMD